MADIDSFSNKTKTYEPIPSKLNVLTILTIVGSGIMAVFAIISPFAYDFYLAMLDNPKALSKLSNRQLQDFEQARQLILLQKTHMIPLLLISLLGCGLCLAGALMMRKLKKEGFWYYVSGQIIPFIGTSVILGYSQFSSIWNFLIVMISFLFISFYNKQRKFLVN
jgi:hypothetical protein